MKRFIGFVFLFPLSFSGSFFTGYGLSMAITKIDWQFYSQFFR